jgi:hypothetical protein
MCGGRGRLAWSAGPPAGPTSPSRAPRRKHRGRAADSGSDIERDRPRAPISPLSRVPSTRGDLRTLRLRPPHLLGRVRSDAPKASGAGSGAAVPGDPSWRRQARRAAATVSRPTTSASDACARRRPGRAPASAPGRRLDVDHAGPWTLRAVRDRIVGVLPPPSVLLGAQELASGEARGPRSTPRFARGERPRRPTVGSGLTRSLVAIQAAALSPVTRRFTSSTLAASTGDRVRVAIARPRQRPARSVTIASPRQFSALPGDRRQHFAAKLDTVRKGNASVSAYDFSGVMAIFDAIFDAIGGQ